MITGKYFQSGPASRIAPKLWQGGLPANLDELTKFKFDLIVLCAKELQPWNDLEDFPSGLRSIPIEALCYPLDDVAGGPSKNDAHRAIDAAEHVVDALDEGKRVLVTCAAGRNRSGLVTALALVAYSGMSGADAVALIQEKRPLGLTNTSFVEFLRQIPAGSRLRRAA